MLRIRKSDYAGLGANLRKTDTWITNGQWMLRRDRLDLVKHAELIATAADLSFDPERVIPRGELKEYRATGEIRNSNGDLDPKDDVVLFANGDATNPAGFDRRYITMLGIEDGVLYGEDEKSAFAAREELDDGTYETWCVIMPTLIPTRV